MPSVIKKKTILIPTLILNIHSTHREIINLIEKQFTDLRFNKAAIRNDPETRTINLYYYKMSYSQLPRSRKDCFKKFTIFQNQYWESDRIYLDVGARTLKTIVDPKTWSIISYIATPPDFEQDLLFDLIFFQPIKSLLQIHGAFLFHSSCVAKGSQGILFSGDSGCGKTTLALSLNSGQFDYLADDEVILCKNHSFVDCRPFPLKPKIHRKSLRLFPEFKGQLLGIGLKKNKVIVDYNGVFSKRKKWRIQPRVLIFPRFVRTTKTRLEPIAKQTALSTLMGREEKFIKSTPHIWRRHFAVLAQLVRQCQVYRLYYREEDLRQIPDVIESVFKES